MGIADTFDDLINQIISTLKTSPSTSAYLGDVNSVPRVINYKSDTGWRMVDNDYFAVVSAGGMNPIGGYTTRASLNEFIIGVSLMYFATDYPSGFPAAMVVAEKIYDLFHLTNINNLCRLATVSLHVDNDVVQTGNLYTVVVHIVIKCERYIVQP